MLDVRLIDGQMRTATIRNDKLELLRVFEEEMMRNKTSTIGVDH